MDIDLNYIGSAERVTMLRADLAPGRTDIGLWTKKLVEEYRGFMAGLLPFKPHEIEFLAFLNDQGEITPGAADKGRGDAGNHPEASRATVESPERAAI